ncbi:ClC family H(+)/Cl(-) exchange transporter [Ilumatobacter sp.]|uniref:ClC family H(+)/Cl(-) exchange transporter n=1 Tax=Ilumatobacter sp. TaxID=1967498 RepID=UPI003C6A80F4
MTDSDKTPVEESDDVAGGRVRLIRITMVAAACGVLIGGVGGLFRLLLREADGARSSAVESAKEWPIAGWVVPVVLVATGAAIARYIVRLVPTAAGSGVQAVEERWRADTLSPHWTLLPAKFVGGLLAIGSGLALGREGPTVHMGAVIASVGARRLKLDREDERTLQAALGGAGLGVAFNAPLGGAFFVFEEVARTFRIRLTVVTLVGCTVAVTVSRTIVGDHPDFLVDAVLTPPGWLIFFFAVFGLATGALGVVYNRLVIGGLGVVDRFSRVPPEACAAVIGGIVGLALWFDPLLAGGGDLLAQQVLGGGIAFASLTGYLVVRFLIGPLSYAAGTPGGLFAPLLVVGAVWGALVHGVFDPVIGDLGGDPTALAIVGMATFFAAVVRAPLTGVVLITEMTATTNLLVPMLVSCVAAEFMATWLRGAPIYDTLRARLERSADATDPPS